MKKIIKKYKFLIIILAVFLVCLSSIKIIQMIRYKNLVDKAKDSVIASYETGSNATVDEFMEYVEFDKNTINAVTIGYNTEDGYVKYYLDNEKAIKEIVDKLDTITIRGCSNLPYEYMLDEEWSLQLYSDEIKVYSFDISGQSTIEEDYNFIYAGIGNKKSADANTPVPGDIDPAVIISSCTGQLLYKENITEFIEELFYKYAKTITIRDVLAVKEKEKVELVDFFSYIHEPGMQKAVSLGGFESYVTCIYTFYIEDSNCYIEIEKEDMGKNGIPYNDIVRISIFNTAGKEIDFYESTAEEIEDFLTSDK